MGETSKDTFQLGLARRLRVKLSGNKPKLTGDAVLLAYRELGEALGFTSQIDSEL